ncbi:Acyl carrier protein 2 [Diplonema papillatum]|nr:Acyl carrier protein 2 [Diplonema papillatum]
MFRSVMSRATPIVHRWGMRSYFLDRADTEKRVMECVRNFQKVPADRVKPGAHFINDLGLDSLDQVEVVMSFEQEFFIDIPDNEAEKILTIDDATEYVANHPQAR